MSVYCSERQTHEVFSLVRKAGRWTRLTMGQEADRATAAAVEEEDEAAELSWEQVRSCCLREKLRPTQLIFERFRAGGAAKQRAGGGGAAEEVARPATVPLSELYRMSSDEGSKGGGAGLGGCGGRGEGCAVM